MVHPRGFIGETISVGTWWSSAKGLICGRSNKKVKLWQYGSKWSEVHGWKFSVPWLNSVTAAQIFFTISIIKNIFSPSSVIVLHCYFRPWKWVDSTGYPNICVCKCMCVSIYIYIYIYTVGTLYNTTPYITGSNIARLGHGSQNSWSKLWIPIVKSAPVRVIFTWKSVPKKSIHASSDIYVGTQWKQRHDSPWSYPSDVIVTFLWYGTIGIIWHRDHQYAVKKV